MKEFKRTKKSIDAKEGEIKGKVQIIERSYGEVCGEGGEYYIIPNWLHPLLTEIGLTSQEKLVYECLLRYSHNSEKDPYPSQETIMKFTGIKTKHTVIRCLNKLYSIGLVKLLKKGGRHTHAHIATNEYKVYYIYEEKYLKKIKKTDNKA
ncbi:helix-turn-helix domain-containing protein [Clostridium polynesiense]|uniref:helix-turn-helix domain-containing protein n=1 Tax=Clostridium polynesiense TaxID=1325933 RepID=UPI00058F0A20|nr:helix-turn-helix domain-containing protein [Clostridium polynesiense]